MLRIEFNKVYLLVTYIVVVVEEGVLFYTFVTTFMSALRAAYRGIGM